MSHFCNICIRDRVDDDHTTTEYNGKTTFKKQLK